MSRLTNDISNGTCYYAADKKAQGNFIPCGNAVIQDVPCCHAGDDCLSSNACFDSDTGNTYMAGCTDTLYAEAGCPFKSDDFKDQEWVGLVICDSQKDQQDSMRDWVGCKVPDGSTDLARLPESACSCDNKAVLFKDEKILPRHAILPQSIGGTISWVPGFKPKETMATTPTQDSEISSVLVATTSTSTTQTSNAHTGSTSTQGDSGPSTATTIGIAVGSAGGALLIASVVLLTCLLRKQKKKRRLESNQRPGGVASDQLPPMNQSSPSPCPANSGMTVSKAELPADNTPMASPPYTPSPEYQSFQSGLHVPQQQHDIPITHADPRLYIPASPSNSSAYHSRISSTTLGQITEAHHQLRDAPGQKPAAELDG